MEKGNNDRQVEYELREEDRSLLTLCLKPKIANGHGIVKPF